MRYCAPLVAGLACLVAANAVSPLIAYALSVVALGLLFDGATALFARATRAGRLTDHRQ